MKIYVKRVDGGESHALLQWRSVPRDIHLLSCEVTGPTGTNWRQKLDFKLNVKSECYLILMSLIKHEYSIGPDSI